MMKDTGQQNPHTVVGWVSARLPPNNRYLSQLLPLWFTTPDYRDIRSFEYQISKLQERKQNIDLGRELDEEVLEGAVEHAETGVNTSHSAHQVLCMTDSE